jgi:hypothetical protein
MIIGRLKEAENVQSYKPGFAECAFARSIKPVNLNK